MTPRAGRSRRRLRTSPVGVELKGDRHAAKPIEVGAASGLDEVDLFLIKELQRDGRQSSTRIAKKIGISESAVRQRIGRILASEVARVTVMTDPRSLGLARRARLGIRCTGNTIRLADHLADLPAVSKVILTAGSFDAIIDVACADDDALLDLVDQELRVLPGVLSVEIMVLLRVLKQNGHAADARLSHL